MKTPDSTIDAAEHNYHAKTASSQAESNKRSFRARELAALADLPGRMDKKFSTGPQWNLLYKTRLCANYQNTGACPYFQKCQFAHGDAELARWEAWRVKHFGPTTAAPSVGGKKPQQPKPTDLQEKEEKDEDQETTPTVSPTLTSVTYDNVAQILRAPTLFETQDLLQQWEI